MLKLVCFVALIAAVTADCNSTTLTACAKSLSTCDLNIVNPSLATLCGCLGGYDTCVTSIGCSAQTIQQVTQQCLTAGCTAAQCTPASVAVMTEAEDEEVDQHEVTLGSCDKPGLIHCDDQQQACIQGNFSNATAVCNCRGSYDKCLYNLGCQASMVQGVTQGCIESGCTPQQCAYNASMPEEPEVVQPLSVGACNPVGFGPCVTTLNACVKNSTSSNDVCNCRGGYDGCLVALGCDNSFMSGIIAGCVESGCTLTQCNVTSPAF